MRGTSLLSFCPWPPIAVGAGADVAVGVGLAVGVSVVVSVGDGVNVGVGVSAGVGVAVGNSGVKVRGDVSDIGVAVGAIDTDEAPHATRSNITSPKLKICSNSQSFLEFIFFPPQNKKPKAKILVQTGDAFGS
jgi:hypothetical protein